MLCDRTGLSPADIPRKVKGLLVTLGGEGCDVWVNGECERVPSAQPAAVVDPTGCGDAWRGAPLFGLEQGWPLARCAELGNKVGALKIAQRGPQNYVLDFTPRDGSVMGLRGLACHPERAFDTVLKALPVQQKNPVQGTGLGLDAGLSGLVPVGNGQAAWGFSVV